MEELTESFYLEVGLNENIGGTDMVGSGDEGRFFWTWFLSRISSKLCSIGEILSSLELKGS